MFNLKASLISGGFLPEPRKVFHLYLFTSGAKWGDGERLGGRSGMPRLCACVCACVCVRQYVFCKSIATLVVSLHHVRCLNCSQLAPHETTASRFGECSFLSVGGRHPRVPATACGSRSSLCVCVHIEFLQCCRAPGRGAMQACNDQSTQSLTSTAKICPPENVTINTSCYCYCELLIAKITLWLLYAHLYQQCSIGSAGITF